MWNPSDPDKKDQIAAIKLLLGLVVLGVLVIIALVDNASRPSRAPSSALPAKTETPVTSVPTPEPEPISTPAPASAPAPPMHEQRLADLRKQREGLEMSAAIEREVART